MVDHHEPRLIECNCGLRFMRTAIPIPAPEISRMRCACGNIIGAWNGAYRLAFEPEDDTTPPPVADPWLG